METISKQQFENYPPDKKLEALNKLNKGELKFQDKEVDDLFGFLDGFKK